MRLANNDWLPLARTLRVGETRKVVHPDDRGARASMAVSNHPDRWSAWCHRRGYGGVVYKDAVFQVNAPRESTSLSLPDDMVSISDLEYHHRQAIGRFLISKGVSDRFLPDLFYSESRQRLLFDTGKGHYLGRDLTETSSAKWVNYRYTPCIVGDLGGVAVLVEDPFSYYKLTYALAGTVYRPVALLGTRLRPKTLTTVVKAVGEAVVMLDGDSAGRRAAPRVAKDLRGFGLRVTIQDLPDGYDPKDLTIGELRDRFVV